MHSTNPVALLKPAVVIQLDIFDCFDDIPVDHQKPIKTKSPVPKPLHDGHPHSTKPVKPGLKSKPTRTPLVPAKKKPDARELLVDPDEPESVNLEINRSWRQSRAHPCQADVSANDVGH